MIAIVDYGVGNLFSLSSSLKKIGAEVVVTGDKKIIESADKIILPGVGAFKDAMNKLTQTGLDKVVIDQAKKGKKSGLKCFQNLPKAPNLKTMWQW